MRVGIPHPCTQTTGVSLNIHHLHNIVLKGQHHIELIQFFASTSLGMTAIRFSVGMLSRKKIPDEKDLKK